MLQVEPRSGEQLRALLPQIAQLRIEVFKDWPYLYEGTLAYEERYLGKFINSLGHVAICCFDGDDLVGASTAVPLNTQYDLIEPFRQAGEDGSDVFYFGESVLRRAYRGSGLGHAFFDGREAHAKALGYGKTAFCAVIRPLDHPLRPQAYRALDGFWIQRDYRPLEDIVAHLSWNDIGEAAETAKPMQFWGRGFA